MDGAIEEKGPVRGIGMPEGPHKARREEEYQHSEYVVDRLLVMKPDLDTSRVKYDE